LSPAIRGLLLCGGASTRFGSNKLLASPGQGGLPIVAAAAHNLILGAGGALAVIPAGARELRAILEPIGCEILESDRTAAGIGASLAAGVEATASAAGWIVALGDMPFIQPATIAAVRLALESGALLAAPVHGAAQERGHPVGFSHALANELLALRGDEGARGVVNRHRNALVLVPVDDRGIYLDIDTPADLAKAMKD
jgi:molybdenum cofactor cytidylyltransferase